MSIHNKGFTLIEMLVVIAILLLLAGVLLASVSRAAKWCKDMGRGVQIFHNTRLNVFLDDSTPQFRLESWAKAKPTKWDAGTNTEEQLRQLIW